MEPHVNSRIKGISFYANFKKRDDQEDRKRYITLRNEVNRLMRKAEAEYLKD